MQQLKTIVIVGFILTLTLVGASMLMKADISMDLGSVSVTDEYSYNQYSGTIATTTLVCSNGCTLGSVVITEDFAGTLIFKNATSTTAYAITNATQIVDMQSALTEGVYTFDVYVPGYLYMVSADGFSFAGDITVTWRD